MNIQDYMHELIFIAIMAMSSFAIVIRVWQDVIIAISVELLVISVGGFLLMITARLNALEEKVAERDKAMLRNFDDLASILVQKHDSTSKAIFQSVESIKNRLYR